MKIETKRRFLKDVQICSSVKVLDKNKIEAFINDEKKICNPFKLSQRRKLSEFDGIFFNDDHADKVQNLGKLLVFKINGKWLNY